MFLWHPDGYIRIGTQQIDLPRWHELEPESALPSGAVGIVYEPGVLHNNIHQDGFTYPAALPWPDGDRYIQKATAGVYSVPPDPAIAARSAAVIAREAAARDNIATPVTGFAETLRTGDQAAVTAALDSVSDDDWRAALGRLLVDLRDAVFAEQLEQ